MREIKFRAWDIGFKRMKEGFFIVSHADINIFDFSFIDSKYIVMQYTGLKDKNGKDIYEGDIVRSDGKNHTVYYYEPKASFQMDLSQDTFDQECSYPDDLEVIGNIYENPELAPTFNNGDKK